MYYRLSRLMNFENRPLPRRCSEQGGGRWDDRRAYPLSLPPFSQFRNYFVSGDRYVSVHAYFMIALGLPLAAPQLDGGSIIHVLSAPNCNGLSCCTGQCKLCPPDFLIACRKSFQEQQLRLPLCRLSHGLQLQSSALQDLASCAAEIVA